MVLLVLVELVHFGWSHAAPYLHRWFHWPLFVALGLSLAVMMALVLALLVRLGEGIGDRLRARSRLRSARLGLLAQASFLSLLAAVLLLSRAGRPFNPSWPLLLAPCVGLAFYLGFRGVCGRIEDGARWNVLAVASIALCSALLLNFSTVHELQRGRFGLAADALLRTGVTFAVPLLLTVAFLLHARAGKTLGPRLRLPVIIGGLLLLSAAHQANLRLFVDSYDWIHSAITVISVLLAWQVVIATGLVGLLARAIRPPWVRLGAVVLAAMVVLQAGQRSVVAYVAAVHTVKQRFAMELVSGYLGGRKLTDAAAALGEVTRRLRGKDLPSSAIARLPRTFRRVVPDPGFDRGGLRNAVLVFLDAKRPEDIGLYRPGPSATPAIDRCFAGAFRFTRAYSAGTSTMVAFPAIYSSTYAATRQQQRRLELPYWTGQQDGTHNLVEAFRGAGLHTRLLTHDWYFSRFFADGGKKAIFGRFDETRVAQRGVELERALRTARQREGGFIPRQEGFLAVIHMLQHDPHEIPGVDREVGAICDEIRKKGHWDRTVMLLTADHGAQFGEHGRQTYGRTLFDEEAIVPLLWRVPRLDGRRIDRAASTIDILPTLVDLFGLDFDHPVEGRSLVPVFRGGELPRDRAIFVETRHWMGCASAAVVVGRFKLIKWHCTGVEALFDLDRDPRETRSLADHAAYREKLEQMERLLATYLRERGE